ncbi:MAG: pyridoxamine kinase [Clostridia bacterium]|nr:pyridoxamine kinase [Clostridia bacterium]
MKDTKRALSVQDISCLGQCSNTVIMPILSAAGVETIMLPTALLSTHTGGFQGYTFLDLTEEMEKILSHFTTLPWKFDYLCTGYFGSAEQIGILMQHLPSVLEPDALRVIDPVMGDDGRLYSIYDHTYVQHMRRLCEGADVITPNLTEACLLADIPYLGAGYDEALSRTLFERLHALGAKRVLLTGVLFDEQTIGVLGHEEGGHGFAVRSPYVDRHFHGTGDIFTGSLVGFLSRGLSLEEAANRAVRFVSGCITDTVPVMDCHWYGLRFEERLQEITNL